MNYLGIDWGSKRIGLALGSSDARLAKPLTVIANNAQLQDKLGQICHEHSINRLVVGLPRNLEGEETKQSATIRKFAGQLGGALGLEVDFQDETLSSKLAEPVQRKAKRRQVDIDSRAAAIILQDYLDSLRTRNNK